MKNPLCLHQTRSTIKTTTMRKLFVLIFAVAIAAVYSCKKENNNTINNNNNPKTYYLSRIIDSNFTGKVTWDNDNRLSAIKISVKDTEMQTITFSYGANGNWHIRNTFKQELWPAKSILQTVVWPGWQKLKNMMTQKKPGA
jgi:hypothetical protein